MVFLPDGKLAVAGGRPGEEGDVRVYDINGGTPKVVDGVAYLDGVDDKGVMVKPSCSTPTTRCCAWPSAPTARNWPPAAATASSTSGTFPAGPPTPSWSSRSRTTPTGCSPWPSRRTASTCVTGSRDKTAKVWDLATKESVLTFPDHQAPVYGVAIKADGKIGFSAGDDNQVRAWNATGDQAGKQIRRVRRPRQDDHQARRGRQAGEAAAAGDGQRRRHGARAGTRTTAPPCGR